MINLYVSYKCGTKERRDGYYNAIKELGAMCKQEDGCFGYDYFFPAEDETVLTLLEHWADQAAFEKHISLDTFKEIGKAKAEFGVETEIKRIDGDYK